LRKRLTTCPQYDIFRLSWQKLECACLYIYIYIYIYMCIYIFMHIHTCICIYTGKSCRNSHTRAFLARQGGGQSQDAAACWFGWILREGAGRVSQRAAAHIRCVSIYTNQFMHDYFHIYSYISIPKYLFIDMYEYICMGRYVCLNRYAWIDICELILLWEGAGRVS